MSENEKQQKGWTDAAHEALVAALARMHGTIKPEEQAMILADMQSHGFMHTWEGIRQHIQKLKRKEAKEGAPNGDDDGVAAPPATPKTKRTTAKANTPKTPRSAAGKKRKAVGQATTVDDDDEILKVKEEKRPKLENNTPQALSPADEGDY